MSASLYLCHNQINYATALVDASSRQGISVIIYNADRITPVGQGRLVHVRWGRMARAVLAIASWRPQRVKLHAPHLINTDPRLGRLLARWNQYSILDDGLDTLREVPRNFDPTRMLPGTELIILDHPRPLPQWTAKFLVKRTISPSQLILRNPRPSYPFKEGTHVFIESPGLDWEALSATLSISHSTMLVVQHPAKAKQGVIPTDIGTLQGEQLNIERSIVEASGIHVYFGETMSFVIASSTPNKSNRLFLCLTENNASNLAFCPPVSEARRIGTSLLLWESK